MAKQLNLLATGQIIPTPLHAEMQRSYLEYAMSVIVGRALPDVRDGLKPVHRRILYAMHELGLTPDRPYRKCARVVGDVLGKYHPHGDQSVYDALVRLVQDFSSRYPLLAGHGNFGSVDNDPPAAMRYTETRLAPIGNEALLSEIGEATVDFIGNFDNSQQEPTVLPAQLPILLLNGCAGIAVGMATNIPPHNLGEVVDGLIALIDRPDLSDEKLWELVPGPDFPTGGEIIGTEGIREAYSTGRGIIPVRGVATIEEMPASRGRRGRTALVVTELPFQVNKASWIEKVAELVNHGRMEGIADLRDESDREGMRVVVELKRDANPQDVLSNLYKQTALCTNFGAILLALVDGQPRQLTLREMLHEFINFREQTLTRQYSHELGEAERRLHIVQGLVASLSQLDAVIEILRNAPDGSSAKISLQERLNISEVQSDAILAMPMRRLTGLERQNLQAEFEQLSERIGVLRVLLSDRHELLKALKKDLRTLKRKFADARRTKIVVPRKSRQTTETKERKTDKKTTADNPQPTTDNPQPSEEVTLEFTRRGYVRRLSKSGNKSGSGKGNGGSRPDDFVVQLEQTDTTAELIVLTAGGKAYPVKIRDIPPTTGQSRGTPLITLLSSSAQSAAETIVSHFVLPKEPENADLILLSKQGKIKRLPMVELANISGRGLTIIKLKEDDELKYVNLTQSGEHLILATTGGRLLKVEVTEEQFPAMGRATMGVQASRLRRGEQVVGCVTLRPDDSVLLVSGLGYAKRLPENTLRLGNLGDIGTQVMQFTDKTDVLLGMIPARKGEAVMLLTSRERVVRSPIDSIRFWGKDGIGDRILQPNADEKIVNVVIGQ
ncbi:DNA topoisomerase 4 subunit A [Cyanobacteria bacterium FACHB-472]|nr:DNA topoisomerase 4 subunit A [Cyanobacteria bacterium FACHB-472]